MSSAVSILIELDPMLVYGKARQLIGADSALAVVSKQIVASHGQLLSDLRSDFGGLVESQP